MTKLIIREVECCRLCPFCRTVRNNPFKSKHKPSQYYHVCTEFSSFTNLQEEFIDWYESTLMNNKIFHKCPLPSVEPENEEKMS